jgi:hypothetical protein
MANSSYANALTFTQKLKSEYFDGWSNEELATLSLCEAGNVEPMFRVIADRLSSNGIELKSGYGLCHSADTEVVYDEEYDKYELADKDAHVHILFTFDNVKGTKHTPTEKAVASALGLTSGDSSPLQRLSNKRNAKENVMAYWIHANDAFKHQYSPKDVYTFCGENYMQYYARHKDKWAASQAEQKRKKNNLKLDLLIDNIVHGKLTRNEIYESEKLFDVYCTGIDACDKAFRVYGERKAALAVQRMKKGEFTTKVFFVYGKSGSGKSSFANGFMDYLVNRAKVDLNENWSVYSTAATNPLDDYMGEEIVFMDDVRGATMSASDWLKLLDPYNATPSSARYKNKVCAARAIIITSSKDPLEFFYYMKNLGSDRGEAIDQFMRRIQAMIIPVRAKGDTFMPSNAQLCQGVDLDDSCHFIISDNKDGDRHVFLNYAFDKGYSVETEKAFEALADMVNNVDLNRKALPSADGFVGEHQNYTSVQTEIQAFGL